MCNLSEVSSFLFKIGRAGGDAFIQVFEFCRKFCHTVWEHIKRSKFDLLYKYMLNIAIYTSKTRSCPEALNWISFVQIVWALQIGLVGERRWRYKGLPFQVLLLWQMQINVIDYFHALWRSSPHQLNTRLVFPHPSSSLSHA